MSELLQIVANAVNAKLLGGSRDTKLAVSEMLSFEVEGFERSDAFKGGSWDGRSSFFDFKSGIFPAGFVHMVASGLNSLGHRTQLHIKAAPPPLGPEAGTFDPLGYGFTERYDYQLEAVKRLVRHGRMIAQVATGGGKSNIATLAVATIRRPTLFLTTRSVLMHQMADAFTKANLTPGVIGDGIWQPRKGVNVGMVQTLAARLDKKHPKREETLALLSYFEFVIGEEAHESGGNSYYEVMQACKNANYRLALTATPFMREDGEANMRLQAAFGSIGIQISEKLLIDRGILATPYFKIIQTKHPLLLRRGTSWPACYEIGITENPFRNEALIAETIQAVDNNLPCILLVQREKHGHILEEMLKKAGKVATFVFGKHEQSQRKSALSGLGDRSLEVLIGSTIFDVGVDVPAVGFIGIAGGGKAEVGHRQRIGRGLREKKTGANICFVADFADECNKHLNKHALMRRAILEGTPGFAENILDDGVNFPYERLSVAGKQS